MLCDRSEGYNSAICYYVVNCPGADGDYCNSGGYWSSTRYGIGSYYEYGLLSGAFVKNWGNAEIAFSARCVRRWMVLMLCDYHSGYRSAQCQFYRFCYGVEGDGCAANDTWGLGVSSLALNGGSGACGRGWASYARSARCVEMI